MYRDAREYLRYQIARFAPFILILGLLACKRDPVWLPELQGIMDKANQDLEALAPLLAREASLQDVYIGLKRLEKVVDFTSSESSRVFRKYPDIPAHIKLVEKRLAVQFKQLRANTRKTLRSVDYWNKQLKNKPEFSELIRRIERKLRKTDAETRPE